MLLMEHGQNLYNNLKHYYNEFKNFWNEKDS